MSRKGRQEYTAQGAEVVSQAHERFIHTSPRKARLAADLVRNKTVAEALNLLQFYHKPSATPHMRRAILSAAKNAEDFHPEPESLLIAEIRVDGGPMFKRIRPRAFGRANRIRKRTCHIHVYLTDQK